MYKVKAATTAFHSAASELGSLDENNVVSLAGDLERNGREDVPILLEAVLAVAGVFAAYLAAEKEGLGKLEENAAE